LFESVSFDTYAAVLLGRITGLACLFVRLSVVFVCLVQAPNSSTRI